MTTASLVPETAPDWALWTGAALLTVAWAATFLYRPAGTLRRASGSAARLVLGTLALGGLLQAVDSLPVLALTGGRPEWALGLLGAAGVETTMWLYASERRTVARRAGLAMTILRGLAVLLVMWLLARPTLRIEWRETHRRTVVVLLDDSGSMHTPGVDPAPARRVRLADALMPAAPERPYRLDETARELLSASSRLLRASERVAAIADRAPETRRETVAAYADRLGAILQEATERTRRAVQAARAPLDGQLPLGEPTREALAQLADHLEERILQPLEPAERSEPLALVSTLQSVATALQDAARVANRLATDLDETFYTALPADLQERMAQNATRPRADLARHLLVPGRENGMLKRLEDEGYRVRTYAFESTAYPTAIAGGDAPSHTAGGGPSRGTDIAAGLRRVLADLSPQDLAGVLLVTDGLHNAAAQPEPLARRLGNSGVPVSTVLVGSRERPPDAAVTAVNAPETAVAGDALYVSADVKLHGMKGARAEVYLARGDSVLDSVEITARSEASRERVELSHAPEADGDVAYRIGVRSDADDVLPENNQYPVLVRVSEERTKVLVLEGRPRWEFRYVRNLFAARDKAVQLQWVLEHPERIAGQPAPPEVAASVSNALDKPRATRPPATPEEWLRFDVIILGDISPGMLDPADWAAIEEFVLDRGGTLVVVAGPTHMPHKFTETLLNGLLPVEFRASTDYQDAPETSYRIALTEQGRRSVMLRLEGTPEANEAAWAGVPEVYWRHPLTRALPAAEVLAYADTGSRNAAPHEVRNRALVATTNQALGRTVFLAFDRTWRLRHKHSDRYHYKFWGQLLRWAAGARLPAGTEHVRLGTDRTRYGLDTPVRITARLLDADRNPVGDAAVRAEITRNGTTAARSRLEYDPLNPGTYTAELGGLPPGSYSVSLQGRRVEQLLAEAGAKSVSTSFSVEPAAPVEHLELAVDSALPGRLAEASGGVVARPWTRDAALASLRPAEVVTSQVNERALWNFWPMLAVLTAILAAEWILRKRAGLP